MQYSVSLHVQAINVTEILKFCFSEALDLKFNQMWLFGIVYDYVYLNYEEFLADKE